MIPQGGSRLSEKIMLQSIGSSERRLIVGTMLTVAALVALRLAAAALTPLTFDEAYYWMWSKSLAGGYYDHPPMVAFVIRAGTAIAGGPWLWELWSQLQNPVFPYGNVWIKSPWWGEYDFTLEPINAVDRPQMMPLSKHFRGTVPPTATATRVPPTATTTATATRVLPTATATRVPSTATATATRVPPTNTPTSTHQAAPCQVAYVVRNDWGYGFIADITVTNKLVTALNQWQFRWTYTGNQVVVDSWNANHSQSSANVTMSGVSWNVTFPANSSITFEIQGAYSGTNNVPKSFTLQNRSCSIQIKTGQ